MATIHSLRKETHETVKQARNLLNLVNSPDFEKAWAVGDQDMATIFVSLRDVDSLRLWILDAIGETPLSVLRVRAARLHIPKWSRLTQDQLVREIAKASIPGGVHTLTDSKLKIRSREGK